MPIQFDTLYDGIIKHTKTSILNEIHFTQDPNHNVCVCARVCLSVSVSVSVSFSVSVSVSVSVVGGV